MGEKGKATSVRLENEDGNLVYTVVIGQKKVNLDAGNAHVLSANALNHDRKHDQNNSSRLRSSIQVEGAGAEDDETNDDGGIEK